MINSLSIIFPIFNESQRLHLTIQDIKKFNEKKRIKKLEYIFVDDGSKDNSLQILAAFIKKNKKSNINYKVLKIKNNTGKGNALKNGVKFCKNDWILTLDSDISVSISQINHWKKKKFLGKKNTIFDRGLLWSNCHRIRLNALRAVLPSESAKAKEKITNWVYCTQE